MHTVGSKLGWLAVSVGLHGVLLLVLAITVPLFTLAVPRAPGAMRIRFVQQVLSPSGTPQFVPAPEPEPQPLPVKPTHTGPRHAGRGTDPRAVPPVVTTMQPGRNTTRVPGPTTSDPRILNVNSDLGVLPPSNGHGNGGNASNTEPPGTVQPPPSGPTEPARLASDAPARRPKNAQNAEAAGTVIVRVKVDPSGRGQASIEQSSGDSDLDRVAKLAAERAKYEPAQEKGTVVAGNVRLKFAFSRDDEFSKGIPL